MITISTRQNPTILIRESSRFLFLFGPLPPLSPSLLSPTFHFFPPFLSSCPPNAVTRYSYPNPFYLIERGLSIPFLRRKQLLPLVHSLPVSILFSLFIREQRTVSTFNCVFIPLSEHLLSLFLPLHITLHQHHGCDPRTMVR